SMLCTSPIMSCQSIFNHFIELFIDFVLCRLGHSQESYRCFFFCFFAFWCIICFFKKNCDLFKDLLMIGSKIKNFDGVIAGAGDEHAIVYGKAADRALMSCKGELLFFGF